MMRLSGMRGWLLAVGLGMASRAAADERLVVLPGTVKLLGREASQRLLVHRADGDELGRQLADGLVWTAADPKVAQVENGVVRPLANGRTVITVQADGRSASATIEVTGFDAPSAWSFTQHVLPILSKTGCNSGACHGALAGKGGFKLSLRGYAPDADYHAITRQARGRRVELADPGRSLLLVKPTGAVPHKGGIRFDVDSREYRILAEWLSAGAAPPREDEAPLVRVVVLPERSSLGREAVQQLVVQARYADGRTEDVTRWAKYTSANEAVARVDEQGRVTIVGPGEGAVTVWFSSKIAIARVTSPYPQDIPAATFEQAERRNILDDLVLKQLRRLHLPPSPPSRDEEFVRRVFLDTIGTLPTADEARAFLDDPAADKRDRLIDKLLARPEFVDYWTYKWSDMLMLNGTLLRPEPIKAYYQWIRRHVQANTPWDRFVREIVTAQGSSTENGATNFFALHQDPEGMAENVSQAFLGLSINCARCHNHPLEKWTNDQYYGMANLFARVRAKGWGGDPRSGDGTRTLYVVPTGDLIQPRTGRPQPPTPLDGRPLAFDDPSDRRGPLADWLTSPNNPYFARAITNRVWANFFGVGLVESVDDLRESNVASNDELLAAAARHLVERQFDLKELMRTILQSKTYQRSSQPLPENQDEKRYYSRYYPRRLIAEVMLDAVSQVTGVPTTFDAIQFPGADKQPTSFYPAGTRAIQLYDSAVASYFLQTFGRNQRRIVCECERSNEPSMVQVLHLVNGDTVNKKLAASTGRVSQWLAAKTPDDTLIDDAYLAALSRRPTDDERTRLRAVLAETPEAERRAAVEDLLWAVMSSREFLFNH